MLKNNSYNNNNNKTIVNHRAKHDTLAKTSATVKVHNGRTLSARRVCACVCVYCIMRVMRSKVGLDVVIWLTATWLSSRGDLHIFRFGLSRANSCAGVKRAATKFNDDDDSVLCHKKYIVPDFGNSPCSRLAFHRRCTGNYYNNNEKKKKL